MKVDFFRHSLDAGYADAVAQVLASPFLTTGLVCEDVEAKIAAYFSVDLAVLVNSWTNGTISVLLALELEPGDEVIVPAMTFIATANVVVLAGGTPVFVDVDPNTFLMTPDAVAAAVTDRTRAVIPVHLYGQMCDTKAIRRALSERAADDRHIYLIEDCAHCFEGTRDGERPGLHSDAAIFSFYASKNVTCGEGGAVISRNRGLFERTLETRLHGMTAIAVNRFAGERYNHWDMKRLGTKANLPDLLAALLPRQIATIDARLPERQRLAQRYRRAFADGPLRLVAQDEHCTSAEHLFPIGVPGSMRDNAIAALNERGIGVTVNYRAVPELTYYRTRMPKSAQACPVASQWGKETLSLPLFPGLRPAEQDYVIDAVKTSIYASVPRDRSCW